MKRLLLTPEQRWECPNCTETSVTREARPHSRMHDCRGLKGLTAPMVPAGTRCKVEAHEREDYLNGDTVTRDGDGLPIMNVTTTREEGNDVAVFAPCATAKGDT
jgi:hypothetical protein